MRCKKHYTDLSSLNGVCATCLRQRLFLHIQQQSVKEKDEDSVTLTVFPRSVSPYRTRVTDHRFFSTPQVGPTFNNENYDLKKKNNKKKKGFIKFSLLTNLFRSKKTDKSATSAASSPSWFSMNRVASPERYTDCGSGYETCQQTPWRTPARRVNSTASGLTFCLSPLVRASPCRNWNHNVTTVMTAVDGGDAVKPRLCANRSRKLADFGRLNPNR